MKINLLIIGAALSAAGLLAQNENTNWHFGARVSVDFSSGVPKTINSGRLHTLEGCASISDKVTGNLLFYTDGDSIWNNQDEAMLPDGRIFGGVPAQSSTQSALIIKKPKSDSIYYVFTVAENNRPEGLQYATIDMSLNGGRGGIINKNNLIHGLVTEKITAVYHCNGEDVWVIAHDYASDSFIVVLVSDTGIIKHSMPAAGSIHNEVRGYMKAFCDPVLGCKIALVKQDGSAPELFDFDPSSGLVTFIGSLDMPLPGILSYGLSFSPDHTKLYITQNIWMGTGTMDILQYSLDAGNGNIDSIIASRYVVDSRNKISMGYTAMQLAPDGKIYIARHAKDTLAIIEDPDLKGTACSFKYDGYAINSTLPVGYGKAYFGLPNLFEGYYFFDLQLDFKDAVCLNDSIAFKLSGDPIYNGYELIYDDGKTALLDTLNGFTDKHRFLQVGKHEVVLKATSLMGCSRTLSVNVIVHPSPPDPNITVTDSVICSGDTTQFDAGEGYTKYIWSTDDTGRFLSVSDSHTYTITVLDSNQCSGTDGMNVEAVNCDLNNLFIPNIFTPDGNNNNDWFRVYGSNISKFELKIYNQRGVKVFEMKNVKTSWDGKNKEKKMPAGTYVYTVSGLFTNNVPFYRAGNLLIVY